MQTITFPTFPENCILLEWSEESQSMHFNEVKKGRPHNQLNTSGYCVIHVCQDHKEAILFARYLNDVIRGSTPTRDGRVMKAKELMRHVKAVIKFSKAYNKLISRIQTTNK